MCELAVALVIANISWMVILPDMCSGMSDYEKCVYNAEIGCDMVEKCKGEPYEMCRERAQSRCDKLRR